MAEMKASTAVVSGNPYPEGCKAVPPAASSHLFGFYVQTDHHFITNEVISFAGVFDFEIKALDEELRFERRQVILHGEFRRKGNLLRDAVQCEVAGDFYFPRFGGFDGGWLKNRFRIFCHIEKVGCFEVAGEFVGIGVNGSRIDRDLIVARSELAIGYLKLAGKFLESSVMFAGNLGADEFYGRIVGDFINGSAGSPGGGGSRSGICRGRYIGGGNVIGRVLCAAAHKQAGQENETRDLANNVATRNRTL